MPVFLHSQNLLVSDHINLVCLPHVLVPDAQQSAHQFLHHPYVFSGPCGFTCQQSFLPHPTKKLFLLALVIIS